MNARVTLLYVAAADNARMTGFSHVIFEGNERPVAKGSSEEKQGDLLRGHLLAFTRGLEALLQQNPSGGRDSILLVCHHEYLVKGIEEWMPRWKANGWRSASRKPVAYAELWMKADALIGRLKSSNTGDVLLWKGKADHEHQRLALAVAEKAAQVGLDITALGDQSPQHPYDGCNSVAERAARDAAIVAADDGSLPWAA